MLTISQKRSKQLSSDYQLSTFQLLPANVIALTSAELLLLLLVSVSLLLSVSSPDWLFPIGWPKSNSRGIT